jgi:hypothetical protein
MFVSSIDHLNHCVAASLHCAADLYTCLIVSALVPVTFPNTHIQALVTIQGVCNIFLPTY